MCLVGLIVLYLLNMYIWNYTTCNGKLLLFFNKKHIMKNQQNRFNSNLKFINNFIFAIWTNLIAGALFA